MKKIFLVIALSFIFLSHGLYSQSIAEWDTTGLSGITPSVTASFEDPFLTAGNITRGSGVTATSASDAFSSSAWAATFDLNDYYQFVLTPDVGYTMNIDTFIFGYNRTATGPDEFELRSDLDGFVAAIDSFSQTGTTGFTQSISLGALFDNITSAITFRLYGYSSSSGAGTFRLQDPAAGNIRFEGTVSAIPEPSTYAMLVLGALCVGLALRRYKGSLSSES